MEGPIKVALFADDGAMWKRGRNLNYIVCKMQQAVSEVKRWSPEWGFRMSIEKTKTVFLSKRSIPQDLNILISDIELERVDQFKYLGMWFDKRLTWSVHINKMIHKCKKMMNVMRCLRGLDWGANWSAMRTIYTNLIRSILDYGCIIYRSAAITHLKKLDVIQSKALGLWSYKKYSSGSTPSGDGRNAFAY